jgi:acyl-CoA synthetase (AMP-forming)/AMP-acid ligase II
MAITACVKRNVQQNRTGCAAMFGSRRRSWGEFQEHVARFAGGLKSLGLETGDRVAILALNSDRYLEYYIAVPWAGCVVVPLNTRWTVGEIVYALNDSNASLLLVDDRFLDMAERIAAEAKGLRAIIHIGDGEAAANMVAYEQLVRRSDPVADAARDGEDLAGIFYTGGTTGFSKGVMLPYRGLWASAMAGLRVHGIDRDSICLHTAPMFHLADFALIVGTLLAGATHAIVPTFEPELALSAIESYRVTHVLLIPTMIRMLVTHPKVVESDLSSLRLVFYGGSPIPEAVLIEAMRVLPDCRFTQAYGMTELSPIATMLTPDYHVLQGEKAGKLASAGQAATCCEVEIVDPGGVEVPRGVVGEVRVRGPNVMLGYWNKPEETAAAAARRLDVHRRCRLHGRGGVRLHRRPAKGHDRHGWRERLLRRGGERGRQASRHRAMRGDRHSRREMGGGCACHRHPKGRAARFRTGDYRPLPHSDCGVQMPSQRCLPDGPDAAVGRRKGT